MQKTTGILVADAARARLFNYDRQARELIEMRRLSHSQAGLRERELDSDRPGRHGGGRGSRHGVGPEEASRQHEAETFAPELGALLQQARREGQFDRLVLMAPPKFLGALRGR